MIETKYSPVDSRDLALVEKLGIMILELDYREPDVDAFMQRGRNPGDLPEVTVHGTFTIDESKFRPMCRLIELVDMICESKNPMVEKQFHHLITLLNLTKENKHG